MLQELNGTVSLQGAPFYKGMVFLAIEQGVGWQRNSQSTFLPHWRLVVSCPCLLAIVTLLVLFKESGCPSPFGYLCPGAGGQSYFLFSTRTNFLTCCCDRLKIMVEPALPSICVAGTYDGGIVGWERTGGSSSTFRTVSDLGPSLACAAYVM